jgi:arylsulfatase A-like enzyme
LWEGGIRSPIFIQWKGRILGGRELPVMTTQLDWLPTALAAAGVEPQAEWKLDGTNLLPLLEGRTDQAPHDALYWRFGIQYAVRQADWKLLRPSIDDSPMLFNLRTDPSEQNNVAAQHPERVRDLRKLWDVWNAQNEQPRWIDERWNGLEQKARIDQKAKVGKGAKSK